MKKMNEWALDCGYGRTVRNESDDYAPCGCVDGQQRCYMPYGMQNESFGIIGCEKCGATWEQYEGADWQRFGHE